VRAPKNFFLQEPREIGAFSFLQVRAAEAHFRKYGKICFHNLDGWHPTDMPDRQKDSETWAMAFSGKQIVLSAEVPHDPQLAGGLQPNQIVALLSNAMKRIADLEALVKTPGPPSASRGKPGRKAVNADIAAFANERRPGISWKEIYYAWKREHPNDPRNKDLTPERIRGDWRRHYGGKDGRRPNKSRAK
jgi:hypothetical protein